MSENTQTFTKMVVKINNSNEIIIEHYEGNLGVLFILSVAGGEGSSFFNLYKDDIDKVIDMFQKAKGLIK